MKKFTFRARFKYTKTGMIIWQMSCPNHVIKHQEDLEQVSEWEQFTGLIDKNGVKIFEGDKVISDYTLPSVVMWDDEYACFAFGELGYLNDHYGTYQDDEWEVIGNIHEEVNSQ